MTPRSMTSLACALVLASAWGCQRSDSGALGRWFRTLAPWRLLHRSGSSENDREIARCRTRCASVDARPALEQSGYRFVARARRTNDAGDYTLAERTADCLTSRYPDAAAACC